MGKKINVKNAIDLAVLGVEVAVTVGMFVHERKTSSTERLLDMENNSIVQTSKIMTYVPKDDASSSFIKDEKTVDTKTIL